MKNLKKCNSVILSDSEGSSEGPLSGPKRKMRSGNAGPRFFSFAKLSFRMTVLVFFTFSFLVFTFTYAFAQREIEDYKYQYEKYREYDKAYIQARSEYLKYGTLTSAQDAIKATQDFLYSRAIVLRTYLQTLKYELKNTPGLDSSQKTTLILGLDGEINWLQDQENQTQALTNATLDDLLELSSRVEKKQFSFQKITYQTLSNIMLGKFKSFQTEAVAINFLLTEKVESNGQGKDVATLRQWLQTVADKTYQSQKNIENSQNYLALINKATRDKEVTENYNKLKKELDQAKISLQATTKFQQEILKEVGGE